MIYRPPESKDGASIRPYCSRLERPVSFHYEADAGRAMLPVCHDFANQCAGGCPLTGEDALEMGRRLADTRWRPDPGRAREIGRVLAVERQSGALTAVLRELWRGGLEIAVARSETEAYRRVEAGDLLLVEYPRIHRCPDVICGWMHRSGRAVPVVGIVDRLDEGERLQRCRFCMVLVASSFGPERIAEVVRQTAAG